MKNPYTESLLFLLDHASKYASGDNATKALTLKDNIAAFEAEREATLSARLIEAPPSTEPVAAPPVMAEPPVVEKAVDKAVEEAVAEPPLQESAPPPESAVTATVNQAQHPDEAV